MLRHGAVRSPPSRHLRVWCHLCRDRRQLPPMMDQWRVRRLCSGLRVGVERLIPSCQLRCGLGRLTRRVQYLDSGWQQVGGAGRSPAMRHSRAHLSLWMLESVQTHPRDGESAVPVAQCSQRRTGGVQPDQSASWTDLELYRHRLRLSR